MVEWNISTMPNLDSLVNQDRNGQVPIVLSQCRAILAVPQDVEMEVPGASEGCGKTYMGWPLLGNK